MKSNVGPGVIAAAVVGLLLVIFVIYHFTMGASGARGPAPTPDNRPEYVKKLMNGERVNYYGQPLPGPGTPATK